MADTGLDWDWYDHGPGSEEWKQKMAAEKSEYHRRWEEERQAELARLRAIVEPLEALRDHECVTVAIVNDDPEANGERASGLYVSDTRIHWHCRPFYGPTLADALAKARAAQVEAEAKEEPT